MLSVRRLSVDVDRHRFARVDRHAAHLHVLHSVLANVLTALDAKHRTRKIGARHVLDNAQIQQPRSEEHTSELQSHVNLVCRLLLEKKKKTTQHQIPPLNLTT